MLAKAAPNCAVILALLVCATPVRAWFGEGHEVVAIIGADGLACAARFHVAQILGVPNNKRSVEKAMAEASTRPDTEFSKEDRSTAPWHYINLCLQDNKQDLAARCTNGNCITAKIDEYSRRLREQSYDRWGAAGDLAFLIHFLGDIHQPLHAATNADRGGTCQRVLVEPPEDNLHFVWDDAVVVMLEKKLATKGPEATARRLEKLYRHLHPAWNPGASERVALETNKLAKTDVYRALGIPDRPCTPDECSPATSTPVTLSAPYMKHGQRVAGRQLAKAGLRLAAVLNEIWPPASAGQ